MATSCDMAVFQPGQHVEFTAIIKYANMHPYILVQKKDDIVFAATEKKNSSRTLKGIPKRPVDECDQIPHK